MPGGYRYNMQRLSKIDAHGHRADVSNRDRRDPVGTEIRVIENNPTRRRIWNLNEHGLSAIAGKLKIRRRVSGKGYVDPRVATGETLDLNARNKLRCP